MAGRSSFILILNGDTYKWQLLCATTKQSDQRINLSKYIYTMCSLAAQRWFDLMFNGHYQQAHNVRKKATRIVVLVMMCLFI